MAASPEAGPNQAEDEAFAAFLLERGKLQVDDAARALRLLARYQKRAASARLVHVLPKHDFLSRSDVRHEWRRFQGSVAARGLAQDPIRDAEREANSDFGSVADAADLAPAAAIAEAADAEDEGPVVADDEGSEAETQVAELEGAETETEASGHQAVGAELASARPAVATSARPSRGQRQRQTPTPPRPTPRPAGRRAGARRACRLRPHPRVYPGGRE